jgi:hypothetical protein
VEIINGIPQVIDESGVINLLEDAHRQAVIYYTRTPVEE